MASWHAEVTLTGKPGDTAIEELTTTLPGFPVITADEQTGRLTVALAVDASTVRQATDAAFKAVTDAARAVLGKAELVGVRVLSEEDYRAEVERPARLDLVGSTEGSKLFDPPISRQRFEELARTHPDFPPHVAELARGKVYTRASVEAFGGRWERRRTGRPPKAKD
ncbi:hypothetical protein [Actinoallomurus sp. CA-142502]|uniref:hypothetical protein n=1 Tax=Actinoallomurus sp. CA-142502 TaxID=3239885 RepID=UPI003D904004